MKTPLHEFITLLESKGGASENVSISRIQISIDALDYEKLKETLLEKEKERMRLIYNGILQNVGTSIKQSDLPTFEQYYNQTYGGNK